MRTLKKAEAERWTHMLGGKKQTARISPTPRPARAVPQPRLDWNAIPPQLPKTFTAKGVAQQAGKPVEQVYTHLSSWRKAKKIQKTKAGYQKVRTRTGA